MKLDTSRPMASLREATGLNRNRFAFLRGVAGPTQIQAERAGPKIGLRVLVAAAAAFGYAVDAKPNRGAAHAVAYDLGEQANGRVSVGDYVGQAGAALQLRPLAADDPEWMHALCREREARHRAYERDRAAKAAARAKRPPSKVAARIRAAQRAAEGGTGDGLEARLAEERPQTLGAFRAMLDGTAAAVYDQRIAPRLAGQTAPSKAVVGDALGVTKQAVHEHELRLVEDLRWLGLAGPLSSTRAPATAGDGARS